MSSLLVYKLGSFLHVLELTHVKRSQRQEYLKPTL